MFLRFTDVIACIHSLFQWLSGILWQGHFTAGLSIPLLKGVWLFPGLATMNKTAMNITVQAFILQIYIYISRKRVNCIFKNLSNVMMQMVTRNWGEVWILQVFRKENYKIIIQWKSNGVGSCGSGKRAADMECPGALGFNRSLVKQFPDPSPVCMNSDWPHTFWNHHKMKVDISDSYFTEL